jgi:ubiquinone/menaquinone biosynthesis C-methylase UbiE
MDEQNVVDQGDHRSLKERQRRAWASGDYAAFGSGMMVISELLCEAVDLRPGERVLDVAAGAGNTALAAARRSTDVTGVDYVAELLERGRERAVVEGLSVEFVEGDAESLPFPDASFDAVLSTFGVMFAPDQQAAAAEMLRVCQPSGRIGVASWTPEGFSGKLPELFGRYLPPPAGVDSPMLWGTEDRMRDLLGQGIAEMEATRRDFVFRYRSVERYIEALRTQLGPTRSAFEALGQEDRRSLESEIEELVRRFNVSGDETMIVPAEYLEVVAVRQ